MTGKITYTVLLFVISVVIGIHAEAQSEPSGEYSPFTETPSIDRENGDEMSQKPDDGSGVWLNGRLEESEPLPVDRELLVSRSYFRLLARQIRNNTSGRENFQGVIISGKEQREILDLLEDVERGTRNTTLERVSAMCDVWNSGTDLSPQERADQALSVGRRMELDAMAGSAKQDSVHARVARILGDSRSDQLGDAIASHGARASVREYSWSDVVRQVGREVEQMEHLCGGEH